MAVAPEQPPSTIMLQERWALSSFVQARTTAATRISLSDVIMEIGMKAWLTNPRIRQDSGSALAIRVREYDDMPNLRPRI
jgi:hypothetical protein